MASKLPHTLRPTDVSTHRLHPAGLDLQLAAEVLRVRLGQIFVNDLNRRGEFRIPIHLALGHEAIAVAIAAAMTKADRLLLSHRNMHYNLARQSSLRPVVDEYRLRSTGLAGGRLGAMNLSNPEVGILYTSSILGNNLGVATGVALANQVSGRNGLAIVTTGDGAMEEGQFYESLVLMKSLRLPAFVVVENNQWSMYTRIEERRCQIDIQRFSTALSLPYRLLKGNDVIHYREALVSLREMALNEKMPILIEVELETLGDRLSDDPGQSTPRHINYHHGVAPTIALSDWPIIRETAGDPLHVLAQRFAPNELKRIARTLFQQMELALQ